jgi:hypothetical protein
MLVSVTAVAGLVVGHFGGPLAARPQGRECPGSGRNLDYIPGRRSMVERRVPYSTREIAGATLTISTMGGYSVTVDGDYIGFMHAAQGNLFNTYQRVPGEEANWLGKYVQDDAVRAIVGACGRATEEAA